MITGAHKTIVQFAVTLFEKRRQFYHIYKDRLNHEKWKAQTLGSLMQSLPSILATASDITTATKNLFKYRLYFCKPRKFRQDYWFSPTVKQGWSDVQVKKNLEVIFSHKNDIIFHEFKNYPIWNNLLSWLNITSLNPTFKFAPLFRCCWRNNELCWISSARENSPLTSEITRCKSLWATWSNLTKTNLWCFLKRIQSILPLRLSAQ